MSPGMLRPRGWVELAGARRGRRGLVARAVRTDTEAGDQHGREIRTLEERMGSVRSGLAGSLRELLSQANSNVGLLTGLSQGRDTIRCPLSNHVARQPGGEWAGGEQVGARLRSRGGRGVAGPSWRQQDRRTGWVRDLSGRQNYRTRRWAGCAGEGGRQVGRQVVEETLEGTLWKVSMLPLGTWRDFGQWRPAERHGGEKPKLRVLI